MERFKQLRNIKQRLQEKRWRLEIPHPLGWIKEGVLPNSTEVPSEIDLNGTLLYSGIRELSRIAPKRIAVCSLARLAIAPSLPKKRQNTSKTATLIIMFIIVVRRRKARVPSPTFAKKFCCLN